MMKVKAELQIPIGNPDNDNEIVFVTHNDGCTMQVVIEGTIEYEVNISEALNLQVKDFEKDDFLYEVDLQEHYYKAMEKLEEIFPVTVGDRRKKL